MLNTLILKINYLTIITLERPRIQATVLPHCLIVTFCLRSWCFDICVSWMWQIPNSSLSSQHTQGPHCWAGLSYDGVYYGNQQAQGSLLPPELLSRTNTPLSELQMPGSGVSTVSPSTQRSSTSLMGLRVTQNALWWHTQETLITVFRLSIFFIFKSSKENPQTLQM